MTDYSEIEKIEHVVKILGIEVDEQGRDIIRRGLTRIQFVEDNRGSNYKSQDGLDTLGDSVIDLIVADYLMGEIGYSSKGDITEHRKEYVEEKHQIKVALKANIKDFVIWGKGEEKGKVWNNPEVLSTCLEALIGAVFLIHHDLKECRLCLDNLHYLNKES